MKCPTEHCGIERINWILVRIILTRNKESKYYHDNMIGYYHTHSII